MRTEKPSISPNQAHWRQGLERKVSRFYRVQLAAKSRLDAKVRFEESTLSRFRLRLTGCSPASTERAFEGFKNVLEALLEDIKPFDIRGFTKSATVTGIDRRIGRVNERLNQFADIYLKCLPADESPQPAGGEGRVEDGDVDAWEAKRIEEELARVVRDGGGEYRKLTPYWTKSVLSSRATQGHKLHFSARPRNIPQVAQTVLPVLRELGAEYKYATNVAVYAILTKDDCPEEAKTQAGKFIVAYPDDCSHARMIKEAVDAALARDGFSEQDFIPVPGEQKLGAGIYTRFAPYEKLDFVYLKGRGVLGTLFSRKIKVERGEGNPSGIKPLYSEIPDPRR